MATVKQRGNGYFITVSNGYDINGKQIRKTATFTPDPKMTAKQQKKALDKFVMDFEEKVKHGEVLDSSIKLIDFYHKWIEDYCKISLEDTTTTWYQDLYQGQILPRLGHLRLCDIKPYHIQNFLNSLSKEGSATDGSAYSPSSVKKYCAALGSLFSAAVKWEVVAEDPTKKVTLPKQKEVEVADGPQVFTPEQTLTFLNALNLSYESKYKGHTRIDDTGKKYSVKTYTEKHPIPTQIRLIMHIAVFGGLRCGEILGLTWDCINFEEKTLTVNKSVAKLKGGQNKQIVKVPKNKTSIRTISIPDTVITLLKLWRQEQAKQRFVLGDK